jgi:hypothetical protein
MPAHRGSTFINRSERSLTEICVKRRRMMTAVTRKEMRNGLTIALLEGPALIQNIHTAINNCA